MLLDSVTETVEAVPEFTECGRSPLDCEPNEGFKSTLPLVLALSDLYCGLAASMTESRAQTEQKKKVSVVSVHLSVLRVKI